MSRRIVVAVDMGVRSTKTELGRIDWIWPVGKTRPWLTALRGWRCCELWRCLVTVEELGGVAWIW